MTGDQYSFPGVIQPPIGGHHLTGGGYSEGELDLLLVLDTGEKLELDTGEDLTVDDF